MFNDIHKIIFYKSQLNEKITLQFVMQIFK